MATKKTVDQRIANEAPVADGDTAHHDLHGDQAVSAPEQAHARGYEETLHGVPAVPREAA